MPLPHTRPQELILTILTLPQELPSRTQWPAISPPLLLRLIIRKIRLSSSILRYHTYQGARYTSLSSSTSITLESADRLTSNGEEPYLAGRATRVVSSIFDVFHSLVRILERDTRRL
ncbi:hypothetical protein PM082_018795 [Marasmius tenuissimus]|nr:hypothetical protein PM082_018795 [Marasmius tenuissimus]